MELTTLENTARGLYCSFSRGNNDPEVHVCSLFVSAAAPEVHPELLACLTGTSLVFDERLVVDSGFRTIDPHIYAAGTLAKFSRRYA